MFQLINWVAACLRGRCLISATYNDACCSHRNCSVCWAHTVSRFMSAVMSSCQPTPINNVQIVWIAMFTLHTHFIEYTSTNRVNFIIYFSFSCQQIKYWTNFHCKVSTEAKIFRSIKYFLVIPFISNGSETSIDHLQVDGFIRKRPDRPWGPPILLYNWYQLSFQGVKRPTRGVDYPPHI